MIRRRGGNCPNTIEVLQQLLALNNPSPLSLALSVILPSISSAGTQQIKSSLGPAVDVSCCIHREECDEPASCYVIRSRSTDSRTIVNYNGLRDMTGKEFEAIADKLGDKLSWCHFEVSSSLFLPSCRIVPLKNDRGECQKSLWSVCGTFAKTSLLSDLV